MTDLAHPADPQQAQSKFGDRGSRSTRKSAGGGGVMDMDSFLAETENAPSRGSSSASLRAALQGDDAVSTRKSFLNFSRVEPKVSSNRRISKSSAKATPSHKPRICSRSRHIASSTTKGGFMQRLAERSPQRAWKNEAQSRDRPP